MLPLLTRLVGGAIAPLVDRLSAFGASLLRKLALFVAAAVCFVVVLIALTIAFDLWIASLAGSIVGALAVAGVYLVVGVAAAALALRGGATTAAPAAAQPADDETKRTRTTQIDRFIAPLLDMLQRLGLRREQLAVLAGASVAKQLRPVPLVGLAIIAGFLVGRMWKGWDTRISTDLVGALLSMLGMARRPAESAEPEDLAA